jgi:DNA modification methylase
MTAEHLTTEYVDVDSLTPDPKNARKHGQRNLDAIRASLERFGQRRPLVVTAAGVVIAGNGTLEAAKALGWTRIAVTRTPANWTDDEAKAYALVDNRTAELAEWDQGVLGAQLVALEAADWDMTALGFEPVVTNMDSDESDDSEITPPKIPKTLLGDVWLLGRHRLMCGDSTSPTDVEKLMAGMKADLVWTDPPYGMSYGGGRAKGSTPKGARVKAHGMIMNDDLVGNDLIELVQNALLIAVSHKKSNGAVYACFTWRTYAEFEQAILNAGLNIKACIVWDKQSIGLGNSHYRPQHEFMFYCEGDWYGDKSQSDIWQMSRGNTSGYVHPTQKPVELIIRALENSSDKNATVLDPFGGSGSTLIAADKAGRTAHLMELDPSYCDVICARFQKNTGITPIAEATGNEHDFLEGVDG